MAVRTIVFDFGNVLAFFDHRRTTERLLPHAGVPGEELHGLLFDPELGEAYESGRISTEDVLRHIRAACRFRCPDETLLAAFADIFWPNTDVCALVPQLRPHYRLLLLSNTCAAHADHFRVQFADTFRHFDALVLSHEVGLRKPQPGIYAHCLQLAGCAAEECVFIDDLPANVAGAQACGWQGIVYQDIDDLRQRLIELGVTGSSGQQKGRT